MTGNSLTSGQRTVYDFVVQYLQKHNQSPYVREIQEGCKISSYKGTIDRLLALEKKGFIRRSLNKHRGIDLVHQSSARV